METNTPQNFPNSKQNQLSTRKYFKPHEATNLDDEKTELMHSNLERFSQELKFCLGNQRTESKKLSYKSNQHTNSTNQQSNQKICMLSTTITGQMTNRANLCSLNNQPANPTQGDFVTIYFKEKSASPLTSHCTDQFEQITNLWKNDRTTQYEDQMADHLENSLTKKDIISTKSHLSAATSVFNQVYPSSSTVNKTPPDPNLANKVLPNPSFLSEPVPPETDLAKTISPSPDATSQTLTSSSFAKVLPSPSLASPLSYYRLPPTSLHPLPSPAHCTLPPRSYHRLLDPRDHLPPSHHRSPTPRHHQSLH